MLAEENGIDADLETKEDIHNWLVAQKNYAENSDSDD